MVVFAGEGEPVAEFAALFDEAAVGFCIEDAGGFASDAVVDRAFAGDDRDGFRHCPRGHHADIGFGGADVDGALISRHAHFAFGRADFYGIEFRHGDEELAALKVIFGMRG